MVPALYSHSHFPLKMVPYHYGDDLISREFYMRDFESFPQIGYEDGHPSFSRCLFPMHDMGYSGSYGRLEPIQMLAEKDGVEGRMFYDDYGMDQRGYYHRYNKQIPYGYGVPHNGSYTSGYTMDVERRPLVMERNIEKENVRKEDYLYEVKEIKNYEVKIERSVKIPVSSNTSVKVPVPDMEDISIKTSNDDGKENEDDNRTQPHHQKKKKYVSCEPKLKKIKKRAPRNNWKKMTKDLFNQMLEYEKLNPNVKQCDLQRVFNVNRSTYWRWKKQYNLL